ncbi:PQQ-binding-like beta-propeller repeat protein, partial [candidate division KSB1 bacterium]
MPNNLPHGPISRRLYPAALCLLALALSILVPAGRAAAEQPALANHLMDMASIPRGICSVLGADNAGLAAEIAASGRFFVHLQGSDFDAVAETKKDMVGRGIYGDKLVVESAPLDKLLYADNTIDLIIAADLTTKKLSGIAPDELLRALRPGGKAIIGGSSKGLNSKILKAWTAPAPASGADPQIIPDGSRLWAVLTKPPIEGSSGWSHWEHGPDNNPVSQDTAIRAPYMTHYFGGPYHPPMPMITTVGAGITFTAMGHIAHHQREEPWLNTLIAQNGYNGTELWRRKLPDGYLVHRSAFIATDHTFYMIAPDGGGCLLLEPETGVVKGEIRIPGIDGDWKWMALVDGVLYAMAGDQADPPQTIHVRSPSSAWSWGDLSSGYYEQRVPWGFGNTIVAWDLQNKKAVWRHDEDLPIDSRAMTIGGDKLFFYGPDSGLGCLDAASGDLIWDNNDPELRKLIEERGQNLTSTPGFRTCCISLYSPDVLFFQGQTRMNVVAVRTRDGSYLWHRQKVTNNPNMLFVEGKLLAAIGRGGSNLLIDPLTGETVEDLGFRKGGCVRLTATWDSFFCRGEGFLRYDR